MTLLTRLDQWKERGTISPEQHTLLSGLSRGEPFSLFLELNLLLYAGVLLFVGGLGWTVGTWSQQIGDVLVLALLSALFGASLWYCFSRSTPSLIFDYVLYFGCLVWTVEFAFIENRFQMLSGQWDLYLLATAGLFFFLAYRFDNRFVLTLALTSLAGCFGISIAHWGAHQDADYRKYAVLYGLLVGGAGVLLERRGLKPHFFDTYLNIAANVLFWAILAGVFERQDSFFWLLCLLAICAASLAWGLRRRQALFVAYAAVYGYIGINSILLRNLHDFVAIVAYFLVSGVAILVLLVWISRRFGREQ